MTRPPSFSPTACSRGLFHDALTSDRAHPGIPQEDRIFEPLIGEWDLRVRWYVEGAIVREMAGEWLFARTLEGRAVQDVWIVPPRGQRDAGGLYEYGTSLRYYEAGSGAWRSTWIGPMHDVVRTFVARRDGDGIVLATDPQDDEGALRWIFTDITADAFSWRNLVRQGGAWVLQQDFRCTRRA